MPKWQKDQKEFKVACVRNG